MKHLFAISRTLILGSFLLGSFTACSSSKKDNDESPEQRLDDDEARYEERAERRRRRAEREDQRYNDWYNRIMGRPAGS